MSPTSHMAFKKVCGNGSFDAYGSTTEQIDRNVISDKIKSWCCDRVMVPYHDRNYDGDYLFPVCHNKSLYWLLSQYSEIPASDCTGNS